MPQLVGRIGQSQMQGITAAELRAVSGQIYPALEQFRNERNLTDSVELTRYICLLSDPADRSDFLIRLSDPAGWSGSGWQIRPAISFIMVHTPKLCGKLNCLTWKHTDCSKLGAQFISFTTLAWSTSQNNTLKSTSTGHNEPGATAANRFCNISIPYSESRCTYKQTHQDI